MDFAWYINIIGEFPLLFVKGDINGSWKLVKFLAKGYIEKKLWAKPFFWKKIDQTLFFRQRENIEDHWIGYCYVAKTVPLWVYFNKKKLQMAWCRTFSAISINVKASKGLNIKSFRGQLIIKNFHTFLDIFRSN